MSHLRSNHCHCLCHCLCHCHWPVLLESLSEVSVVRCWCDEFTSSFVNWKVSWKDDNKIPYILNTNGVFFSKMCTCMFTIDNHYSGWANLELILIKYIIFQSSFQPTFQISINFQISRWKRYYHCWSQITDECYKHWTAAVRRLYVLSLLYLTSQYLTKFERLNCSTARQFNFVVLSLSLFLPCQNNGIYPHSHHCLSSHKRH